MPTPEQDRQMLDELKAHRAHVKPTHGDWCPPDNQCPTCAIMYHLPWLIELAAQALQTPPVTDESALRKACEYALAHTIANGDAHDKLRAALSAVPLVTPEEAKRRAEQEARRIVAAHLKRTTKLALEGDVTTGRYLDLIADITQALLARGGGGEAWIPVGERMPELDTPVLVCVAGQVDWARLNKWEEWINSENRAFRLYPTHWMPLPNPPSVPTDRTTGGK